MNAITKRIWRLAPLARNTISTRRSTIFQTTKTSKISQKSGSTNMLKPITPFIQCRFHSSKSDNVLQTTLIREWNDIGNDLIQQERWDEALEAANKVLKIDPNNHQALFVKRTACYPLKQYQAALECHEILLAQGSATELDFFFAGMLRCHLDQYDEALECFKQSRKLRGKEEYAYFKLFDKEKYPRFWAQVCNDIDDYGPRSMELLRRALKDFPNDSDLYSALSICYARRGKYNEAKEFSQRAIEIEPNNGLNLMMFGGIELRRENLLSAAQLLDKSIELGCTDREEVWNWRFAVAYKMENYDDAEKYLYRAFEYIKGNKMLLHNAVILANELNHTSNEPERAVKLLEKVISFGNEEVTPRAERALADALIQAGRFDEAIVLYRKLHERNPSDTDVTFTYAMMLEPKEALPYFEELSRTAPNDVTWEYLGKTYSELSQYEKSIDAFNKAVAIKETKNRYHNLADCYAALRQHQKEHQAMLRTCELAATDEQEDTRYFSVWPLVTRWQYKQALKELDEFLRKKPNLFDALSLRASTLKDLGRETEALETIDKAISIQPHLVVYLQKVDILATFGRFDEASKVIKHTETLFDQHESFRWVYDLIVGITLHKQGRHEEALELIDKGISGSSHADLFAYQRWVEKAKTLEALQRTDEAITNYEYVLSIFPEEPHSLLHLAKLYHSCGLNSKALALVPRLAALHTDIDSFNNEVAEFLALMK